MNDKQHDYRLWAMGGMVLGSIVYAIDALFRLKRSEVRRDVAERDSACYRRLYDDACLERADLKAKIHELEWELTRKEKES